MTLGSGWQEELGSYKVEPCSRQKPGDCECFLHFSSIYLRVVAWHQKVKGQLQEELRRIEEKILFQRQYQFVSYLFDNDMNSDDPNDDVDGQ